jgi:LacI family transcriptional regulator
MQAPRSRTTLNDVALQAGVSIATASRVLSGSRDRVRPALAIRVEEAAAELDYRPNPHARALVQASSPTVAVIVHDLSDPYFSELVRGALRVAAADDRLVMICASFRDPDREVAYVREMRTQRMHAVLIAGGSSRGLEPGAPLGAELAAYRAEGGRVAVMVAGHGHPAAVPDHRQGGAAAARHLLDLGHRRLGVITGPEQLSSVAERLAGVEEQVRSAGHPDPVVVFADFTREGGAAAVESLMSEAPETTGVLALNDLMAAGAIRRLEQLGLTVPGDVSVVGFDDIPLAADFHPSLTTVRIPLEEIGAAAMRLALSLDPGSEYAPTEVFGTELVVRQSTGPPPH